MSQLYLIAVGGTGMRCLESFVHLCAIGMFDNHEVNVLVMDTDFNNGNLERTRELLDVYGQIKKAGNEKPQELNDTFFSAKLNVHYFSPEYRNERSNFRTISRIGRLGDAAMEQNESLASLLFEPRVQDFDLNHGYRAQTHIGSHLMYHAILEEARSYAAGRDQRPGSLVQFLDRLGAAGDERKVFVMGSIFGGTGASSIPIIPKALQDAYRIINPNLNMPSNILYGATLLTSYFKFSRPNASQLQEEGLIADSDRFGLNCQAALKFYNEDITVRQKYKCMYHLGWPKQAFNYDDVNTGSREVVDNRVHTGGTKQKNPAHLIELMAAFAAYHFFNDASVTSTQPIRHVYKSISKDDTTGNLVVDYADLVGANPDEIIRLQKKLSSMLAFALLIQLHFKGETEGFRANVARNRNESLSYLSEINPEWLNPLNKYLGLFLMQLEPSIQPRLIRRNWLQQIRSTTPGPAFLRLNEDIFSPSLPTVINVDWERIWEDSYNYFSRRLPFLKIFSRSSFDLFRSHFTREEALYPDFHILSPLEKLLNHTYKSMAFFLGFN
jgi:hypothetical protein